jgi:hypothetical protein
LSGLKPINSIGSFDLVIGCVLENKAFSEAAKKMVVETETSLISL